MSRRDHIMAALIYRARLRDCQGDSRDWLGFMIRQHRRLARQARNR